MNAPRLNKWGGDATAVVDGLAAALAATRLDPAGHGRGAPGRDDRITPPGPAPAGPAASPVSARRVSRSPNVVERPTRQGTMILPPDGPATVLRGVTAQVWAALVGSVDAGDLVQRLSRNGTDAAEVVAALADLRAMGALRELR